MAARDAFMIVINRSNPDEDLCHFCNEWMALSRDLHGGPESPPEVAAAIRGRFYGQMESVPNAKWANTCYVMSSAKAAK
eukprot:2541630-Pyramimonas_sp.AAC.1